MSNNIVDNNYSPKAIIIVDNESPEDTAMLQALYSRSSASVREHLYKIKKTGSGKFMDQFYVGYGHRSIGDCGSTTIFIEGVSLLAAKAIQDWPLYSGQETSTRYIDMSAQSIIDPINTKESNLILSEWMDFYIKHQLQVADIVKNTYPQKPDEGLVIYNRAVKARVFDIMRGFLPAGITTQLAWHTNLRQARDHLSWLSVHPLKEVTTIANYIRIALDEKYPHSGFSRLENNEWITTVADKFTYFERETSSSDYTNLFINGFDEFDGTDYSIVEIINKRPKGSTLPHFVSDLGQITFCSLLDFGSFRDLQRHRNGVCRMPLLTTNAGFEPWYIGQLDWLNSEAYSLVEQQTERIDVLDADKETKQYYTALGYQVPIKVTYGLPTTVYMMELRSGKTSHPTLRRKIHEMIKLFKGLFPDVALHADMDLDDWDIRRGTQTITEKP